MEEPIGELLRARSFEGQSFKLNYRLLMNFKIHNSGVSRPLYNFGGRFEKYLKNRIAPTTKNIEGKMTQEP